MFPPLHARLLNDPAPATARISPAASVLAYDLLPKKG